MYVNNQKMQSVCNMQVEKQQQLNSTLVKDYSVYITASCPRHLTFDLLRNFIANLRCYFRLFVWAAAKCRKVCRQRLKRHSMCLTAKRLGHRT